MVAILQAVVQSVLEGAIIIAIEELIRAAAIRVSRRAGAGPTVTRDIGTGLRIAALVIAASAAFSATGLASEFTALTISGVAALAVSLALQTTLSNVISGLLLFNDGAIRLHDDIEYSGVKGRVVRIALRNTWIKTETGKLAIVSNSSLMSGPLINHSATQRLSERFAIE